MVKFAGDGTANHAVRQCPGCLGRWAGARQLDGRFAGGRAVGKQEPCLATSGARESAPPPGREAGRSAVGSSGGGAPDQVKLLAQAVDDLVELGGRAHDGGGLLV